MFIPRHHATPAWLHRWFLLNPVFITAFCGFVGLRNAEQVRAFTTDFSAQHARNVGQRTIRHRHHARNRPASLSAPLRIDNNRPSRCKQPLESDKAARAPCGSQYGARNPIILNHMLAIGHFCAFVRSSLISRTGIRSFLVSTSDDRCRRFSSAAFTDSSRGAGAAQALSRTAMPAIPRLCA